MDLEETLLDLERQFWQAAGDPDFYRGGFADDGVMAFHVGIMNKAEILRSMDGAGEWAEFSIDEPRFVQIAPDAASLTYTTRARPAGSDEHYAAAITSVYARRGEGWLLVLHQQTPLESP